MLLSFIILFSGVFAGGLTVLWKPLPKMMLKLLLAFTGSLLFSIAVLDLMPEVFQGMGKGAGIYILGGFFLQIILEFWSHGIEHGHVHRHTGRTFLWLVMTSLCLHSLLEGMAVFYNPHNAGVGIQNITVNKGLFAGILLHHIPIAIALMALFAESGLKTGGRLALLAIFALMPALGMYFGANAGGLLSLPGGNFMLNAVTGVVTGILLHISTTILFESEENHRFNIYKFITVIFGAVLAWVIL